MGKSPPQADFFLKIVVNKHYFLGKLMLFKPILREHFKFFTFSSIEVSRETRSTAVCSRQTDLKAGIAFFAPAWLRLWERTELLR